VKKVAVPLFLFYGWSSIVSQTDKNILPQATSVDGLYLAGHWVISGVGQGGVTQASLSGKYAAKMIIKKVNIRA